MINIYHFNPTCEYAVGNGLISWQPNLLLQKMESELALLPIYLAESSDYILAEKKTSKEFYNRIKKLDICIPQIVTKNGLINSAVKLNTIDRLLPWGWSPAEHNFLKPFKPYCSETLHKSPVFSWKQEHRDLYSKKFALGILKRLLTEIHSTALIASEQTAHICTNKKEIEELLKTWGNLMIKAPWSSSGRGLQPITKTPVHPKVWEKIYGMIQDQGYVMVEPLLNKVFDLAFQFNMNNGKAKYLGVSNFYTDKKGQYQGNYLNGLPPGLPPNLTEFISSVPELILPPLIKVIEDSELAKYYEGNFGVDTLIFGYNNKLKINPCLEINVRQNMGLLSLYFEKLLHRRMRGKFRTFYNPRKSFYEFVHEMEYQFPLVVSNQKIRSGFFPLTDFNEHTMFGAYILVE